MAVISVSDILSYARILSKTDSNGLTDANGTSFVNDALYDLRRRLIDKRQDLFIQESTRDITSAEVTTGAYPGKFAFPSDMWLLKNIQVNLTDVTNAGLYVEAKQVDSSNLPPNTSWEYLKLNQPATEPLFDYRGDWFEIAPTPTSSMNNGVVPMTAAIRIFYFLGPTDLNATTSTLSFPESLDYRILSYKTASIYLATLGNPLSETLNAEYDKRIKDQIGVVGSGEQRPTQATGIRLTGFEF